MNSLLIVQHVLVPLDAGEPLAAAWARHLPGPKRAVLERRRDPADRAATLAGFALLTAVLTELGVAPGRLGYAHSGQPFVTAAAAGTGSLGVSLAHAAAASGARRVACAVRRAGRIGIDLEPHGAVSADELRLVLDARERAAIAEGHLAPTDAWVMKEAVLKAAGDGAAAASRVALRGNRAQYAATSWHLERVDCGEAHVAWLALDLDAGGECPAPTVGSRDWRALLALRA